MTNLLQPHTVKIYNLTDKECTIERVNARSLLSVLRFDLFAKLYYIKNREQNPKSAIEVYKAHIYTFNPDFKEPGRTDKNGILDFINAFDNLIEKFKVDEFDDTISIIPVDKDNIILDGAHRVAALAYFNKEVTIARFKDVVHNTTFDYKYFTDRGLNTSIARQIACEMCNWVPDIRIACLWPRLGNEANKNIAQSRIGQHFNIGYIQNANIGFREFTSLIRIVYKAQPWLGCVGNNFAGAADKASNCYAPNKSIRFILFDGGFKDTSKIKEDIRGIFKVGKHSIHITDNNFETLDIVNFIFGRDNYLFSNDYFTINTLKDNLLWRINYLRNIALPRLKSKIYHIIHNR